MVFIHGILLDQLTHPPPVQVCVWCCLHPTSTALAFLDLEKRKQNNQSIGVSLGSGHLKIGLSDESLLLEA